jgi:glycosyltransferase involved in cell wall biosynthesis
MGGLLPRHSRSDLVVLYSDNEGTSVRLIDVPPVGVPVVNTQMGGAAKVALYDTAGLLVAAADRSALAHEAGRRLTEPAARSRVRSTGRPNAIARFSLDRLVDDVDRLHRSLLTGA